VRCFNWWSNVLILPGDNDLPKRKFQARQLVHESVDFVDQNALNLTNEHLYIKKFFRGLYPRTPVNRGREKGGEEKGKGKGEGMGRRRVGDEGYRTGRRGGDGIRKKGKGKGREGGKHSPRFSPTPPVWIL
jgi:hypothetical protein